MLNLEDMQEKLKDIKSVLKERFKVQRIGIFGSWVRAEQREDSDIDILVEYSEKPGFFKFIELEDYISEALGVKVDLVIISSLKPNIGKRILSEVVFV